jgi:hypothetical protein
MRQRYVKPLAVVVGCGKIGNLYRQYLENFGFEVFTVDANPLKQPQARDIGQVPSHLRERTAIWIVCLPTVSHYSAVSEILGKSPNAKILIEKPICAPSQLAMMEALLGKFSEARIAISDTYAASPVVQEFMDLISGYGVPARSLSIELTKNRGLDEINGRFVDTDYGDFGYEGFHLLSLRDSVLNLVPVPEGNVHLFSSVRGQIRFPDLRGSRLYKSLEARQQIQKRTIPMGSEFRFRIVEVEFRDNVTASLAFEPYFGQAGVDSKNTHVIALQDQTGVLFQKTLQVNQLQCAFYTQIEGLLSGQISMGAKVWARHSEIRQRWPQNPELCEVGHG